ncbi:E3 ubiquitin-protein ligase MIB2-like isoform X1 [Octopus sinensis]|uniref:E3 ubiquitin-protein ligase MIB2-like isoform X1 n=1 Tax=Octopus sinensis TaxID=2607531 RepID=A0A7E6EK41_9MOLL|nr:E3 ubiquitin-protein ligase MIB2-like isoform X1 [Octopus sinensis]
MFVFLPFSHRTDVVAFLVSSGANVNKHNSWGDTPLHLAVEKNYEDVVKVLLNSKENNNLQVNLRNILGCIALHVACLFGHIKVVELLLQQNGTDVNAVQEDGWTALHVACHFGHRKVVELLLQQNGIDANKVNLKGDTPLHQAVRKRHYDVVASMLVQDSVKLDIENNRKRTPLLEAMYAAHLGIVHKLIIHGANMNAVDNDGNNCLHLSIIKKGMFHSEVERIYILDKCCAKLGLPIKKRISGVGVASYLAHQGANLYRKNNKNVAPLDLIGDADLKEKFKVLFPPPQCMLCEVNEASMELQPCAHTVLCEDCSKIQLKTCIESKRRVVCPKCKEKAVKTVVESVECPKCKEKVESFVCPKSEEKGVQTVAESVVCPKSEEKAVKTVAESVDSVTVEEIHLHRVSQKLAGKWMELGRELGIRQNDLEIIRHDYPQSVREQGFQMLFKWHQSTDPEKRTPRILKAALKETECYDALKCLSSEFN